MVGNPLDQEMERLNNEIRSCTRCPLCEEASAHLTGEGRPGSRLLLVAQAPGAQEDAAGRMFIGPSGTVFRKLLHHAGISWDEFYVTNLIKCRLPHNRRPKQLEIQTCSTYLDREIALCQPEILVPLGYYAARYLFASLLGRELSRAAYPSQLATLIPAGQAKIFPLSHPALLLHQSSREEQLYKQYHLLSVLRSVCIWYEVCPITAYTRKGLIDPVWSDLYCRGNWASCVRYQMEEQHIFHPDHMMPDGTIDRSLP
jgi:uracil-DNA glycosylase